MRLSDRQTEVMTRYCDGKDNATIAAELNISISTVGQHLQRAKQKLKAGTMAQAAVLFDRQIRLAQ